MIVTMHFNDIHSLLSVSYVTYATSYIKWALAYIIFTCRQLQMHFSILHYNNMHVFLLGAFGEMSRKHLIWALQCEMRLLYVTTDHVTFLSIH
jgi:hypothetical protein